jgi:hypothetical protein
MSFQDFGRGAKLSKEESMEGLSDESQKLIAQVMKSKWKPRSHESWSFFCPLCKAPRKIPYRSKPGSPRQIAAVASAAAFFTLVTWPLFSWKGIVSFVPLWTFFEIWYRTKVRGALSCRQCGFDPYLYLTDADQAKAEVETYWRKKFDEKGIPYPEKGKPASAPVAKPESSQIVP